MHTTQFLHMKIEDITIALFRQSNLICIEETQLSYQVTEICRLEVWTSTNSTMWTLEIFCALSSRLTEMMLTWFNRFAFMLLQCFEFKEIKFNFMTLATEFPRLVQRPKQTRKITFAQIALASKCLKFQKLMGLGRKPELFWLKD